MRTFYLAIVIALALAPTGCGPASTGIPKSISEYEHMPADIALAYPKPVILMHNLVLASDKDYPGAQRVQALQLVNRIAPQEPLVHQEFAVLLADPATAPEVRAATLEIVLAKDDAAWTGTLIGLLPKLKPSDTYRTRIVAWICRHPGPVALAEIVKVWATLPPSNPSESLLADIARRVSGKEWEAALTIAINSPEFPAGAAAAQVLAVRLNRQALGPRIDAMTARTPLAQSMQTFWRKFNYLPATITDCQIMETIWAGRADSLDAAAKLYEQWKGDGYEFHLRDIHLLMQMGGDPIRQPMSRIQLIRGLRQNLLPREHVHVASPTTVQARQEYARDDLEAGIERLTMADLWTMQLLYEMFSRPRIQAALRTMSLKDRSDTRCAWGGLVFYREGGADAVLYKVKPDVPAGDLAYTAPPEALADGREAVCRFISHFEKENNSLRAGPTAEELRQARELNISGVIFTSVSADMFCAHYYSPSGVIVSLGCYPLLEWK